MRHRTIIGAVAAVALIALTVGCSSSGSASSSAAATSSASSAAASYKLANAGYVTVAAYGSYAPWITIQPDGSLGGLDGTLIEDFAKDNGLKVKIYQTDFSSMPLAVGQGKADIAPYLSYTAARAKTLYYTSAFQTEQVSIYTLKSFNYTGPDSLKGKKVGTVTGYWYAQYLSNWCKSCTTLFPSSATGAQALLSGQIDAWVTGATGWYNPPLSNAHSKVTINKISGGDFGMPASEIVSDSYNAVACDNSALAKGLDTTLKQLQASGQWAKILAANGVSKDNDAGFSVPVQGCGS